MGDALLHRACPVCGSRCPAPHWRKGELTLVRCGECGMVYANPMPAGMASGEFKAGDSMTTALCVFSAMVRFFHPQIIAQCATKPGPTLEQMVDFVISSISVAKG